MSYKVIGMINILRIPVDTGGVYDDLYKLSLIGRLIHGYPYLSMNIWLVWIVSVISC